MADAIVDIAIWDSEFFGRRIARARKPPRDAKDAEELLAACARARVECVYLLVGADDPAAIRQAEANGFRLMDIRVTFEHGGEPFFQTGQEDAAIAIRPFEPADAGALRGIARTAYRVTRFYADSHFPRERCDDLYEAWTRRSCEGYADAVLVAVSNGVVKGYISCHLQERQGRIGLVGVEPGAEGAGIGLSLVRESLRWFSGRGTESISVTTQGRNCRAQRLYERCGFLIRSMDVWYHRWFAVRQTDLS